MTSPPSALDLEAALHLFNLTWPVTHEHLSQRYEEARRTWHPSRYAGLTNNPGKYMEMYKKGEAKTKEIHAAYQLILTHLNSQQQS